MTNKYLTLQITNTGFKHISKFPLASPEIATAFIRSYGIANNIPLSLFVIIPIDSMTILCPIQDNIFKYSSDCHSYPDLSIGPLNHKKNKSQIRSDIIDISHPLISGISKHAKSIVSREIDLDFTALNPITEIVNIPIHVPASELIYDILITYVSNPDYNKRMNFATSITNPQLATSNRDADLEVFNKIKYLIDSQPPDNAMNITIDAVSKAIALFYGKDIELNRFQSFFPHLHSQLA
jgi:hypothetical protein